uniref:Uncharacterized protein n=1 Tax=Photinus pyralis TaxID=7054 RepID=A0A1Y1K6B1_PHOPY
MSKYTQDFSDETVLTTPKPRASSTIQREYHIRNPRLQKIPPLTFSPNTPDEVRTSAASSTSLGILNVDDIRLNSLISTSEVTSITQVRQRSSINTSKDLCLPSRYLKPSEIYINSTCEVTSDSTVNESDLIDRPKLSFKPDDVSTPRSSGAFTKVSITKQSTSRSIAELSHRVRNSDLSLAELCNQYCRLSDFNKDVEFNEESFVPGELAADKFAEYENLWRKELSVLGGAKIRGDSILSQFSVQDQLTVPEFFPKGSESLDESLFKRSPEKKAMPVRLLQTTLEDTKLETESVKSSFGVTELEDNFSAQDDTAKIIDLIAKMPEKRESRSTRPRKENVRPQRLEPSHFLEISKNTLKVIEPLKDSENLSQELTYYDNTVSVGHAGTSSVRTASSLDSLPGGKLPIETNRIELVWGCVRVGKRKIQNFILRNRSQNKLRLQMTSSNSCFRILSDHSELDSVSELSVFMHPSESRSFRVVFIPTSIGATVGQLRFSPATKKLEMQYQKKQVLHLYAYGGFTSVEIQDVLKDTNMKMWLSLGKLDNVSQLHKKFNIKNVGNVSAFALLRFTTKALYQSSKLLIHPTEIVLHPKETATVNLTYSPTKEDVKSLFETNNQVMEIGSIQMVTGAEILRGRIRRLCNKLKVEYGKIENPLMERLSKKFPDEKMPSDLNQFKESVGCVKELMQNFDLNEITVTLERDDERTLVGQIGGMDESSMFHSLCEHMNTEVNGKLLTSACVVEPSSIILTPPTKTTDAVLLISHSSRSLQFETKIEPAGILEIFPGEGLLAPGETNFLQITCDIKRLQQQKYFKLFVYVDDDVSEVDIKVFVLTRAK